MKCPTSLWPRLCSRSRFLCLKGLIHLYCQPAALRQPFWKTRQRPKLTDGLAYATSGNSLQFNGDVTVTIDLREVKEFNSVDLFAFQRPRDFRSGGSHSAHK